METLIRTTAGWRPNEVTERILARADWARMPEGIDWNEALIRLDPPPMPAYVRSSIHGIEGGYGNVDAATTWDPVVEQIFAEYFQDESAVRDILPASVSVTPARILDVACGTGESTRAWRRAFGDAAITAFDVSPFMSAVAEAKLATDRKTEVRCLDAEHMPFDDGAFDVVTAMLLFHELPTDAARAVLREMRRVCRRGGEVAVLEPYGDTGNDGRTLHPIPFPEPYLKEFLATDWDQALVESGFGDVRRLVSSDGWVRVATAR
jgi:SAM-dependent methyltransferase